MASQVRGFCFVAVALCSTLSAFGATNAQDARRRGNVAYTCDSEGRITTAFFFDATDEELNGIDFSALSQLKSLTLGYSNATDRAIARFRSIPPGLAHLMIDYTSAGDETIVSIVEQQRALDMVSLNGTNITDRTLSALGKLESLGILSLKRTKITDAGLKALVPLQRLYILHLENTSITDAGLVDINKLQRLFILRLDNTGVTDEGILQLRDMKRLQTLTVSGTKVTETGKAQLKRFLPKLRFTL